MSKMKRPTAYDRDQHELICDFLKVSSLSDQQGDTAFEKVIRLSVSHDRMFARLAVLEKAVCGCVLVADEDGMMT